MPPPRTHGEHPTAVHRLVPRAVDNPTREARPSPSPASLPPAGGSRRMWRILERRAHRDRDPLPSRRLVIAGSDRDWRPLLGQALDDHPRHLADVGEHLLARGTPGGGTVALQLRLREREPPAPVAGLGDGLVGPSPEGPS